MNPLRMVEPLAGGQRPLFAVFIVLSLWMTCACSKDPSPGPEPAEFRIADYVTITAGAITCQGEFSPDYAATACWRDSIGQPITVSNVQAFPVYRKYLGYSEWEARAYIFYRGDSLFMADSVLPSGSFRFTYLMAPAVLVAGRSYVVTANPDYIDLGPDNEAYLQDGGWQGVLRVVGEQDVIMSNGDRVSNCLRVKYDWSDVFEGLVVDLWLGPDNSVLRLFFAPTGEGVETVPCP
jgi:hypothetical protein